jgi:thioredoxin reductase (NADPH)
MRKLATAPVVFVVDGDASSLGVLLSDLSGRFGNDFTVRGATSPDAALVALQGDAPLEAGARAYG